MTNYWNWREGKEKEIESLGFTKVPGWGSRYEKQERKLLPPVEGFENFVTITYKIEINYVEMRCNIPKQDVIATQECEITKRIKGIGVRVVPEWGYVTMTKGSSTHLAVCNADFPANTEIMTFHHKDADGVEWYHNASSFVDYNPMSHKHLVVPPGLYQHYTTNNQWEDYQDFLE